MTPVTVNQMIYNCLGLSGIFLLLLFTLETKKYMKRIARRHHV